MFGVWGATGQFLARTAAVAGLPRLLLVGHADIGGAPRIERGEEDTVGVDEPLGTAREPARDRDALAQHHARVIGDAYLDPRVAHRRKVDQPVACAGRARRERLRTQEPAGGDDRVDRDVVRAFDRDVAYPPERPDRCGDDRRGAHERGDTGDGAVYVGGAPWRSEPAR